MMVTLRPFGFVLASQLISLANCEPQISFPINSQLPPVARVDELFSYVFSEYTFRSDTSSNLTYTLGEHPKWLSLDSDERRLYGIPEDKDVASGEVVGQTVEVVATDDTGSTTMNSTLVVSRRKAPVVEIPLSQQIEAFGNYSAPSSLLVYPSTRFAYRFDKDTFDSSNGVNYYATSGDSSPLPAWITFDETTLTFTGTTPPFETLVQPPQNFSFQLVASDIVGFAAESIAFSIVVGSHRLTTDNPIISLNATRGSKFTYSQIGADIRLDDEEVTAQDLKATVNGMPKWLSFDEQTWRLEGTPGKGDRSTNFTISFSDPFADTLDILAMVNVATGLFKSTFDDIEAEPGEEIELDLGSHLRDPEDVEISVTTSPKQDWLKVDGLKISGRVPKSAKGDMEISIKAQSKSSDLSETEKLQVSFLKLDGTITSTETVVPTSTKTVEASNTADDDDDDKGPGHLPVGTILLATLIPIFTIGLILLVLACFIRRRRKAKETYLNSTYRHKISKPVLETLVVNGSDQTSAAKFEKVGPNGALVTTTTLYDPKKAIGAHPNHSSSMLSGSSGTVDVNPSLMMAAGAAMPPSVRTLSEPSTPGEDASSRRSWVTVEDGRGERSGALGRQSVTTVPDSVDHQLRYPSDRTFRSGLDVAIPSLDDLSMLPELMSPMGETSQRPRNFDALSMASSDVLPSSAISSPFNLGTVIKRGLSINNNRNTYYNSSENRPSTAPADSEDPSRDSVSELKAPGAAVTRNSSLMKRASGLGNRSSTHTGSFLTDTSFGSSENWRVVGSGRYGASGAANGGPPTIPGSPSYHDLVQDAPFNPSRPGTSRGEEDRAAGPSATGAAGPGWKRDDSVLTGGSKGSYTVFL